MKALVDKSEVTECEPAARGDQEAPRSYGTLKALVVALLRQRRFHPHLPVLPPQRGLSFKVISALPDKREDQR